MTEDSYKPFKLSVGALKNRKTVFLLAFIILVGGIGAYNNMPKENFPELAIPEIYVGVAYPGANPKFIAEKITDPIENELSSVKNVDEIKSSSIHGFSTITVKFDFSVTAEEALRKVKDAVDKARAEKDFPKDLPVEPNIFEMDVSEMPIMNINLSGDISLAELKDYAEILEEKIEDLPEISKVDIRGVQEQELRVEVDMLKAQAVQVGFGDIEQAIQAENISMSGGELPAAGKKRDFKIDGEFKSPKELADIIVKQDNYKPIYLRDIATVEFTDADTTSYAREFGKPVVMLDVKKRSGQNLLIASAKIDTLLAQVQRNDVIPADIVTINKTLDQSNKTREMVSNLENSIYFGVILVVGVLMFFLGLRNAAFVGIAIPLSMLMSFLILGAAGVTLNVMVLFSMVLALGMLVDNGIVVVENIYRLMDEGFSAMEAAKRGVSEVAWPIIASTATTLAAFVPLAFWPGIMGEFMKYLPITLMIVLGSSLFVALVINPVFTAIYMKLEEKHQKPIRIWITAGVLAAIGALFIFGKVFVLGNMFVITGIMVVLFYYLITPATRWFQNKFLPRLEGAYNKFLTFSLKGRMPVMVFLGTFLLLIVSIMLVAVFPPKVLFFPENEPNYVNIFVTHPEGTDISKTNETAEAIDSLLLNHILKEEIDADTAVAHPDDRVIQTIVTQVGEGTSDPAQGVSMGSTPHKARITVTFAEYPNRGKEKDGLTTRLEEKIRDGLKDQFPSSVEVVVEKNRDGPPQEPPVNIEFNGELEYDSLIRIAEHVRDLLRERSIPGLDELRVSVNTDYPELPLEIDREKARAFNTSTGQIATAIRTALFGKDVSTYKVDDETYDIVVRAEDDQRESLEALLDQKLVFMNKRGAELRIPIRSVVKDPKPVSSYSAIKHQDQEEVVTVFAQVLPEYNPNEVVEEVKIQLADILSENPLPDQVKFDFTGQQEQQAKEMGFLSKALMIAVFLILLIIVSQFNSYSTPSIIMFSVVLSLIGVLLGLVISGDEFVVIMTMIGIISLAGVVVNNAIVLIDYTNLLRKRKRKERGLSEEELLPTQEVISSIIEGGRTRLRPVLLTAITTILGLIPLAMGINIDFQSLLTDYDPKFYMGGDNTMFFGPMSWTIIYGLTFATFLTLVFVPVMYLLLYKFKIWLYRVLGWKLKSNL